MSTFKPKFVKARAKVLAREDRELKAALIRIRQESDLTQKDVAEIMGVSQQAIHKLERYDSDPKASTLRRYANALGAMYEHRVQKDHGQSAWLAAHGRWATARKLSLPMEQSAPVGSLSAARDWRTAKTSDIGLAG